MKTSPTREELLSFFDYDREDGTLIWKNHWNSSTRTRLVGKVVRSSNKRGYISVELKNKKFKIHRLIWFIENGDWPDEIDHINGDKKDNRISNLRAANRRQNNQNRTTHRQGRLQGTYWHKKAKAWVAQIVIEGKNHYLGLHDTEIKAHQIYCGALSLIGENK